MLEVAFGSIDSRVNSQFRISTRFAVYDGQINFFCTYLRGEFNWKNIQKLKFFYELNINDSSEAFT